MPKCHQCLYFLCTYGSLMCTRNGLQCIRHKSKILADVKQDFLFPLSLSFVLFFVFVAFMCWLFSKVSQSYGSTLGTNFFKSLNCF
jgi:hypothetical protein